MTLMSVPIDSIDEDHLRSLILVGVRDDRMLQQGGPLHYYSSELRPVDRNDLLVPEVMVEL